MISSGLLRATEHSSTFAPHRINAIMLSLTLNLTVSMTLTLCVGAFMRCGAKPGANLR